MLVCTEMQKKHIPHAAAQCKDTKQLQIIQQSIDELHKESSEGFEMCCQALALRQLAAGTYRPITDSIRIRKHIVENWDRTPNLTIRIDPEVPDWLMLPKLLLAIIIRNALHNAGVSDTLLVEGC